MKSAERIPRVGIVHDWLLGMRGGERCLEVLADIFPEADIFTLFYDPQKISPSINRHRIFESGIGQLPGVKRMHRYLLPAYPLMARELGRQIAREHQKNPYDLVISVSHCAAKNVPIPVGVPHLCYCLTPVRYLWDKFDSYFRGRKIEPLIRALLPWLRRWDLRSNSRIDRFVAISEFVRERIFRIYGRESPVVYPPVAAHWIRPGEGRGEYFLAVNALVPYKNTDCIVRTFGEIGLPLVVVGSGPELGKLQALARSNITFREHVTDAELAELYRGACALVFAAEEDFGIAPLEAQAAGRPVIAYGRGGALETVVNGQTGLYFSELTSDSLGLAVRTFLDREGEFTVEDCLNQASRFSVEQFSSGITQMVNEMLGQISERDTMMAAVGAAREIV